jgi:hypothetical protein
MSSIFGWLVVIIIFFLTVGIYVWAFSLYSNYQLCLSSESSYCPSMYCDIPSATCKNYPYRPDPVTGAPICNKYLLTQSAPVVEVGGGAGGGGGG